jgi:hypothetical protein
MKELRVVFALFVGLLSSPGISIAQDEVALQPAYAYQISYNVGTDTKVIVAFVKDKSYECVVFRSIIDDLDGPFQNFFIYLSGKGPEGQDISLTFNGDLYPAVSAQETYLTSQINTRFSYTALSSGTHVISLRDQSGSNANTDGVTMDCRETTLYGSYNRFFAGTVIVEIENRALRDVPAKISITDSSGNVVIDKQSVTAKAGTRTDVIFASLPESSLGQIVINHEAPAGVLSGTVAEYDFNDDGSITLKRERPLRAPLLN